jgi:hypothetical protein
MDPPAVEDVQSGKNGENRNIDIYIALLREQLQEERRVCEKSYSNMLNVFREENQRGIINQVTFFKFYIFGNFLLLVYCFQLWIFLHLQVHERLDTVETNHARLNNKVAEVEKNLREKVNDLEDQFNAKKKNLEQSLQDKVCACDSILFFPSIYIEIIDDWLLYTGEGPWKGKDEAKKKEGEETSKTKESKSHPNYLNGSKFYTKNCNTE